MAATKSGGKKVIRRRRERKNIERGQVHIRSSFNNTMVTVTDTQGNAISWASSGGQGFRGSKKSTPFAAQTAAEVAAHASGIGVDAVIVQDLGAVRMLRQSVPDLPIHGSTQMSVHSLDGVKLCADLGMTRVVLGRELSRDQIAYICKESPIEIEVFGHGALCMCYSGQCAMSALIGGRSGNRGRCAQPCRLPYGVNEPAKNQRPLSLKDSCMADHLGDLAEMGVSCLKIEGRMRRPGYVSAVTDIYARRLEEGRKPTPRERALLERAFSRSGFTDAYWRGAKGRPMLGFRPENAAPAEEPAPAGADRRIPVEFTCVVRAGVPCSLAADDGLGNRVAVTGPVPEPAGSRPLTLADLTARLQKTGGTPYRVTEVRSLVQDGLAVPLSALNGLRRQVLDGLSAQRAALPQRRHGVFKPGARYENYRGEPDIYLSLRRAGQLTFELIRAKPDLITLPAEEIAAHPEDVNGAVSRGVPVAAVLPRICFDRELDGLRRELEACREAGVTSAYVGNLGLVPLCRELGFTLRGDFGLQVFNSQGLKEYKRLGFQSLTASFELKLAQLRDISKAIPVEGVVYGRLPLMITENCIIKNRTGQCACEGENILTDRKGERFPVVKAPGCRSEILNSRKLFLADKPEWKKAGLTYARLMFTTENPWECAQALERYNGGSQWAPAEFTRGLYYRGVE